MPDTHSDLGDTLDMRMQLGQETKKFLGSAMKFNNAGCKVVLDGDNSYIEHKATHKVVPIYTKQGNFVMNLWVKRTTIPDPTQQLTGEIKSVNEAKAQAASNRSADDSDIDDDGVEDDG